MLNNIKGKYVEVGVSFIGGAAGFGHTALGGTKYYEGKVIDFDKDFIMFEDGSMIGIRYIQIINIKKDN